MIKTTQFNLRQEKVLESILKEVKHACSVNGYVAHGMRITPAYHIGVYKKNKHIATITIVLGDNIRAWSDYHKLLDRPKFVKQIVHRLTR